MASGGARNRSGPAKDPESGRSQRLGIEFLELPAGGYSGRTPPFPLPDPTPRERDVWKTLWKTPQASAWARPQYAYKRLTIALYTRRFVISEGADARAADITVLTRLADQIGLTPAGLAENGWKISADQVAARRQTHAQAAAAAPPQRERRLRAT